MRKLKPSVAAHFAVSSLTPSLSRLLEIAAATFLSRSTNCTKCALRDKASNPKAPVPANKSRHRAPAISCINQLNKVSRTLSIEGRRPGLSNTGSLRPRQRPAIIRMEFDLVRLFIVIFLAIPTIVPRAAISPNCSLTSIKE